jgi:hypothetical protein
MSDGLRIGATSILLPDRRAPRAERRSQMRSEPLEEIWDAEVVEDADEALPAPGWLTGSAAALYARAGFERPAPLIDYRA